MKEIKLTKGMVALVDDGDFDWLSRFRWYAVLNPWTGTYYAVTRVTFFDDDGLRKGYRIGMHRMILNLQRGDGIRGDHEDHNTLNNRRYNLRRASVSQNRANGEKHKVKSSAYKGVSFDKRRNKYRSSLFAEGVYKHLGYFVKEVEAAARYNVAALEAFGEFAALNQLPEVA